MNGALSACPLYEEKKEDVNFTPRSLSDVSPGTRMLSPGLNSR